MHDSQKLINSRIHCAVVSGVSSPVRTLHTAITSMIKVLELRSPRKFQWQLACEALLSSTCYHVSDCSVQCMDGTRNIEATVYTVNYMCKHTQ